MTQQSFLEKHFHLILFSGLLLGLVLSWMYSNHQILMGDQTQMLKKGYIGAELGVWLSYGNEASTVGNVPGSLSAYIIGLPLLLWNSPLAPMVLIFILHLISFFLFDAVIKKLYDQNIRIVFLVLFWLNPWFLFENLLYNPTFLFFFASLHFWTAFHMHEKRSFFYSFLHISSIGMTMQLHFSWPLLAVITTFLFYKKAIKVDWIGVITAFAVLLISLIPYLHEMMINDAIMHNSKQRSEDDTRYIGWGGTHVYPVFKAFLYWFRYASMLFTNKIVNGAHFDWVTSVEWIQTVLTYLWRIIVFTIGGLSLWISWKANASLWKKIKPIIFTKKSTAFITQKEWIQFYIAGTLIAILISAILAPLVFNYWHLMLIFPFALFPILIYIHEKANITPEHLSKYLFILALYFTVINLVAIHDSKKYSYKVDYVEQSLEYMETFRLSPDYQKYVGTSSE